MSTVKHLSIALVAACAVCASAEDSTPDDESTMEAMASVVKAVAYPAIKYGANCGATSTKATNTRPTPKTISSIPSRTNCGLCLQNVVAGAGGALAA